MTEVIDSGNLVIVLPPERRVIVALKYAKHGVRSNNPLNYGHRNTYLRVTIRIGKERGMSEKNGMYARRRRNEEQPMRLRLGALMAGRLRATPVTGEPTPESPVRMDIHGCKENDQFKLARTGWRQHTFTQSHLSIFLDDISNVWRLQSDQIC